MANKSRSIASELESFRRVGAAAAANKAKLPKESVAIAADLAKRSAAGQKLNSEQERLKAELRKTTAALNAELRAGKLARTKILRLAEVVFGSNAPELVEFRGAGEA